MSCMTFINVLYTWTKSMSNVMFCRLDFSCRFLVTYCNISILCSSHIHQQEWKASYYKANILKSETRKLFSTHLLMFSTLFVIAI